MAKGKSKPRREERKKPKPRYAWLLPLVLVVPMASGCSVLDWATGADEPASLTEDGTPILAPDSPLSKGVDLLAGTGPIGAAAATILAFLGGRYVKRRKESA